MMETGEDKLTAIVGACHTNARSLISSAKLLVDHDGLMSAAYHLALLAIEETGKAALLRVNHLKSVYPIRRSAAVIAFSLIGRLASRSEGKQ